MRALYDVRSGKKGRQLEREFNTYLKATMMWNNRKIKKVLWVNEKEDKKVPYDFIIVFENNETLFIDVEHKGSEYMKFVLEDNTIKYHGTKIKNNCQDGNGHYIYALYLDGVLYWQTMEWFSNIREKGGKFLYQRTKKRRKEEYWCFVPWKHPELNEERIE